MFTDPIADMLTRIRNGVASHKDVIPLPYSKMKANLAQILTREGYISEVNVSGEGIAKTLEIKPKDDRT